jgi:hypothetical protein
MVGKLSSASYAPPANRTTATAAGQDGAILNPFVSSFYCITVTKVRNRRYNTGGTQFRQAVIPHMETATNFMKRPSSPWRGKPTK